MDGNFPNYARGPGRGRNARGRSRSSYSHDNGGNRQREPNRQLFDGFPLRGQGQGSAYLRGGIASQNWRYRGADDQIRFNDRGERRKRGVGFKILEELAQSESSAILMKISKRRDAFMELLKSPIERPDVYPLIVQILARVCQSSFDSLKLKLLIDACNSQFLIYLQNYLMNLPYGRDMSSNKLYWDKQTAFWEHLIQFFECITTVSPSTAIRTCLSLIESTTKVCLQGLSERHDFKLSEEYELKLDKLRSILTEREKEVEAKKASGEQYHEACDSEPPNNFRELSVVPTSEDLLESQPYVRPNIVEGAYRDLEHYLDVQYRLLREDCYGPVREGIRQFIQQPARKKFDSVRIFRNVTFVEPYVTNLKFGYLVQLDGRAQKRFKNINWNHSKRFIYGSLLLFTKDNCKTFIMATVLDHLPKYLAHGKIPVSMVDKSIGMEICFTKEKYTMIESEVYFEPYHLVLSAMKDPKFPDHLSMSKYIVNVEPTPRLPTYLKPNHSYTIEMVQEDQQDFIQDQTDDDMSAFREYEELNFEVADDKTWPSSTELGLNESQYEAFKLALTHEFAVIQGPPGTGKTFLGVKIATTLIKNLCDTDDSIRGLLRRVLEKNDQCRLLVICYTNHALDQFLEAILPVTESVARIGSQSRNEAMDKYNISNLRKKISIHEDPFWNEKSALKAIQARLKGFQERLFSLHNEVLSYSCVKRYTEEVRSLELFYGKNNEDPLQHWLFEHLDYNVAQATMEDHQNSVNFDMDDDESRKKKNDVSLDDFDDHLTEAVMGDDLKYLECSFSLTDAFKLMNTLMGQYVNAKSGEQATIIQTNINILNAQIHLYREMSAHRGQNVDAIFNMRNPTRMPMLDRWLTYFRWADIITADLMGKLVPMQKHFVRVAEHYEESRMMMDLRALRNVKVIGMTTSAAARMRKLLISLAPPIVIVEEAAEVLEQHIITSLTKHTKHLILIGDHQQLRPSAAHMKLARHYNIEVSLFERMIMNNIHSRRLSVQHRMRPEIAALICPHIYTELINHPSVKNFPDVRGMTSNLFFLTHDHKEEVNDDSSSKSNPQEADMVLGLANYLIQQDYSPQDVTILSAYSGQMFYLRKQRPNYSHLQGVKITVVDNYQGEESKIILLSLVRNNDENKIGFLGTENRICVALSRAREGFYMFGNIEILRKNSELWENIAGTLEKSGSLGKCLTLRCERHHDLITVSSVADFNKTPEGGCMLKCAYNLSCGHPCPLICHGYDRGHSTTKCVEKCERLLCESRHVCPLMCAAECEPCKVPVEKVLACSHTMALPCSMEIDDKSVKCPAKVTIKHPDCGHEINKMCHLHEKYVICPRPCIFRVENCGHMCVLTCHVKNDPHHKRYLCPKPCAKAKQGCMAGLIGDRGDHQCSKKCHETCDPCIVEVMKKRTGCKHSEQVPCNKDVNDTVCKKKCARSLPCGHFCKNKCFEPCGNCKQMVTKTIPDCGHTIKIPCKTEATRELCINNCERTMQCGHPCTGLCCDPCDEEDCTARVEIELDSPCGHKVRLPCNVFRKRLQDGSSAEDECLKYCEHPCHEMLMCGHRCQGTCSGCSQGRIHGPCKQVCHQMNICGHQCKEPCNEVCPPCKLQCEVRCDHTRCNKMCGDICRPCQEPCSRRCPHGACSRRCGEPCSRAPCDQPCALALSCGHPCHGLCGEPCPDICRECHPEDFPKDFLGDDFDDDARFVKLEDCPHIMEIENMDTFMLADKETIAIKTCPFCRKPIINTARYKDLINKTIALEINPVKERVYGTKDQIKIKHDELLEKVLSMKERHIKDSRLLRRLIYISKKLQSDGKGMSLLSLNMLAIQLEIYEMISEILLKYEQSNSPELKSVIKDQLTLIYENMSDNKNKISQQQQKDIGNEIKRLHSMIQLTTIIGREQYKSTRTIPKVEEAVAEAKRVVFGWRVFNEKEALEALGALEKAVNLSGLVSKQERDLIVKAIGLKAGHWYKCPNGHLYCIDACGGAMEVSKCNECGSAIGGQSHRLLSDNRHAPEMDGSTAPAWPIHYNDMANYDFD